MANRVEIDGTVALSPKLTEGSLSEPPTDLEDTEHNDEEREETESNPDGSTESETDDGQDDEQSEADEEFETIDEAEEIIANPSKDIKGDLKQTLERDDFGAKGTFSYSRSYDDAPNPVLNLAGLGIVSLPLSESAAKRVISGCTKAPIGKVKQTVADTNMRGTWMMDASKIIFENSGWNRWINNVILPAVCKELGVSVDASKPKAEFYKLFIYKTGSHVLSHQDTRKSPEMFGTMVVLLPSQFSGGSLHLSHAGNTMTVDVSAQSLCATHIAAWYTDVYHSVDRITSGYRLALAYNIIHTGTPLLKPSLSNMDADLHELRHILLSWRKLSKSSKGPEKIVYLLDHLYPVTKLRGCSLEGKDAHRVASLHNATKDLGFRMCLGQIELCQSGEIIEMDSYDDEPEMREVDDSTLEITDLFALDGKKVTLRKDLELDEDECIPHGLSKATPDHESCDPEEWGCRWRGTLSLIYRHSIILIWPLNQDGNVAERDYAFYAKESLGNVKSTKPTEEEQEIVQELIEYLTGKERDRDEVIKSILAAVVHWRSPTIWINACKAAKVDYDSRIYNAALIERDMKVLGFKKIKSFLVQFMRHNRSDAERLDLLRAIEEMGYENENKNMRRWARTQRQLVLRSLRRLESTVVQDLIPTVQRQGAPFLISVVLPQLTKIKPNQQFIIEFVSQLKANNLASTSTLEGIIALGISNAELFPRRIVHGDPPLKPRIDIWLQTIQSAYEANPNLAYAFFKRLEAAWDKQGPNEKAWLESQFFPEAIVQLETWAQTRLPPIEPGNGLLRPFWKVALKCSVPRIHEELDRVLTCLSWTRGSHSSRKVLYLTIKELCIQETEAILNLARDLHYRTQANAGSPLLQPLLSAVTKAIATEVPLHPSNGSLPDPVHMLHVVNSLLFCNSDGAVETYLKRLEAYQYPVQGFEYYIKALLTPVVRGLVEALTNSGRPWPSEPFSTIIAQLIKQSFKIVTTRPKIPFSSADIRAVGCGSCSYCAALRTFLLNDKPSLNIQVTENIRQHVEHQVKGKVQSWGFTFDIFRNSFWSLAKKPRKGANQYQWSLKKPQKVIDYYQWLRKKTEVAELVNSVGGIEVQKALLGDQWISIAHALNLGIQTINNGALGTSGQPNTSNSAPSRSNQAPVTRLINTSSTASTSRPQKRTYDAAMGDQGTESSTAKRSKPSKLPTNAIELSD